MPSIEYSIVIIDQHYENNLLLCNNGKWVKGSGDFLSAFSQLTLIVVINTMKMIIFMQQYKCVKGSVSIVSFDYIEASQITYVKLT